MTFQKLYFSKWIPVPENFAEKHQYSRDQFVGEA